MEQNMETLQNRKEDDMEEQRVTLANIDIPFGRMVMIILKWMIASIPAVLLMYLLIGLLVLVFGVGIGGCAALMSR